MSSRSNPPGREDFFSIIDRLAARIDALENTMRDVAGLKRTAVQDANYNILTSDSLIAFQSLTFSRGANLPAASASNVGQRYIIKDESGNASVGIIILVSPSGAQTIDGAASKIISTAYGVVRVYSTGSGWMTW